MELYEAGKRYWEIVRRFNAHRDVALMRKVAVNDMTALLPTVENAAVRSRILGWLARNQKQSPSNSGGNGGPPRRA